MLRLLLAAALCICSSMCRGATPTTFGDVRDRLACQLPGHTAYPFCDTTKPIEARVADLIQRINDTDKPGLLTARAVAPLPYLGVPGYGCRGRAGVAGRS